MVSMIFRFMYTAALVALVVLFLYLAVVLLNRGFQALIKGLGYEYKSLLDFTSWRKKYPNLQDIEDTPLADLIVEMRDQWILFDAEQKERFKRHVTEYMEQMREEQVE